MRHLIVAGGSPEDVPDDVALLGRFDAVVCADGGAHTARRLGLAPDVVVGDLDSIGAAERARLEAAGCRFVVHPAAKEETDLELALLWSVGQGAQAMAIVGALGGRPDHLLANLMLLADSRFAAVALRLHGRRWEAWITRTTAAISGGRGDIVSLIPLSARVAGIVTDGLEYPLRNETLKRGPARGVSNVMTGATARVTIRRGLLMIMHGRADETTHVPPLDGPTGG